MNSITSRSLNQRNRPLASKKEQLLYGISNWSFWVGWFYEGILCGFGRVVITAKVSCSIAEGVLKRIGAMQSVCRIGDYVSDMYANKRFK